MNSEVFNYYCKINYFGQKEFGWKNAREGLNNIVSLSTFSVSSGVIVFLVSYFRFSFFLWLLYAFFFFWLFNPLIEKKIKNSIHFESLDYAYNELNLKQKIKFSFISVLFLILSFIVMIVIVIGLSKLFK